MQYKSGLAEEARILCASVAELEDAAKKKASMVGAKRKTADMKKVA